MSTGHLRRAFIWLVTTIAVYLVMNGAQLFETVLIVPSWTAAPPASLALFHGEYKLDFKTFWIAFHSLHEITFILVLVFSWKLRAVRRWLLVLLSVHLAVRVWTIAYFAPTVIAFQQMSPAFTVDPALVEQAAGWRNLNCLRVLLFCAVNLALIAPAVRVGTMLCSQDSAEG